MTFVWEDGTLHVKPVLVAVVAGVRILTGRGQEACYSGTSSESPRRSGLQQLSELREGHVIWDETFAATGKAFLRRVANDVSGVVNGLDEAPTAALLARQLDGDRQLGRRALSTQHL